MRPRPEAPPSSSSSPRPPSFDRDAQLRRIDRPLLRGKRQPPPPFTPLRQLLEHAAPSAHTPVSPASYLTPPPIFLLAVARGPLPPWPPGRSSATTRARPLRPPLLLPCPCKARPPCASPCPHLPTP